MTYQSVLPRNATKHERDIEAVISPPLSFPNRDLWNPDKCPEHLLPHLAWALSVPVWDSNWPILRKRQVIQDCVFIHRTKGTRAAVERTVSAVRGDDVELKEWFEDENLMPGEFEVKYLSTNEPIDGSELHALIPAINAAKNVRSSLKQITITSQVKTPEKHIPVSRQGIVMKTGPWFISSMVSSSSSGMACISRMAIQVRSGPFPISLEY